MNYKTRREYQRRARIADRLNRIVLWTVAAGGYAAALFVGTTAGFAAQQPNECLRACTEARDVLNDLSIILPCVYAMMAACIAVVALAVLALRKERRAFRYRAWDDAKHILSAARLQ